MRYQQWMNGWPHQNISTSCATILPTELRSWAAVGEWPWDRQTHVSAGCCTTHLNRPPKIHYFGRPARPMVRIKVSWSGICGPGASGVQSRMMPTPVRGFQGRSHFQHAENWSQITLWPLSWNPMMFWI